MRGATAFSGIGAPEIVMPWIDWQWHAEIEPFPSAVMAHHHPGNENLGDITAPDFMERAKAKGPIDIMVGGPPCQAFSIAGLRGSMSDDRGNLSLQWVRTLRELRPSIAVTENVPGWLNTFDNAFGCFLGAIVGSDAPLLPAEHRNWHWRHEPLFLRGDDGEQVECHSIGGQWGWEVCRWPNYGMVAGNGVRIAWRVLDAQYTRTREFPWAVPQRRRRVFVVIDLGAGVINPAEVLFDAESLRGDPAPRRETGESVAPTISARTKGGGGLGTDFDCDGGLIASERDVSGTVSSKWHKGSGGPAGDECQNLVAHSLRAEGFDASEDGTGRGTPIVPMAFAENSRAELRLCGGDGQVSAQLTTGGGKAGQGQPCIAIQERAVSENPNAGPDGAGFRDDGAAYTHEARSTAQAIAFNARQDPNHWQGHSGPIDTDGSTQAVAFDLRGRDGGALPEGPHETANLRAASGGSSRSYVADQWAVRRLTPLECSRLQGFPDDFARIPWRGKPAEECPDGPQYKAYGNSMPCNVLAWIGHRIQICMKEAK